MRLKTCSLVPSHMSGPQGLQATCSNCASALECGRRQTPVPLVIGHLVPAWVPFMNSIAASDVRSFTVPRTDHSVEQIAARSSHDTAEQLNGRWAVSLGPATGLSADAAHCQRVVSSRQLMTRATHQSNTTVRPAHCVRVFFSVDPRRLNSVVVAVVAAFGTRSTHGFTVRQTAAAKVW